MNMDISQLNVAKRRRRLVTVFFATFFVMTVFMGVPVYALDMESIASDAFISKINEFYIMFTKVVRPIGAVLLAYYALSCLWGGQKEIEKNLGKIKFLILALIATWILPWVLNAVISWVVTTAPPGGGLPISTAPTPAPTG